MDAKNWVVDLGEVKQASELNSDNDKTVHHWGIYFKLEIIRDLAVKTKLWKMNKLEKYMRNSERNRLGLRTIVKTSNVACSLNIWKGERIWGENEAVEKTWMKEHSVGKKAKEFGVL